MYRRSMSFALVATASLFLASSTHAEDAGRPSLAIETDDGTVRAGDLVFDSWQAYFESHYFQENGSRCGTVINQNNPPAPHGGSASDCTYNFTNPSAAYDPAVGRLRIPVVVHVIRNSSGTQGNITEAMVASQIDVLNEDYLALPGTNGQNGTNAEIEFFLATEDPSGNPTNGITYSNNTTWFNDGGGYYNSLAWDTNRYLNFYTNTAGGFLGYVPDLPQGGIAGSSTDRVVCHYLSFGRNSPGSPYHLGRTATHEVGHYLGLYHTFDNGCGSNSCYTTNDRICDTPKQSSPNFGCSNDSSCGVSDDFRDYMDYTNDSCMTHFTSEQNKRMRCSMEHYRPNLHQDEPVVDGACCLSFGCLILSESVCDGNGGDFEGTGTACTPDPCPPPPDGACCLSFGCVVLSESVCDGNGGDFEGSGTSCAPDPCPPLCPTVTGDISGDGSILGDDVGGYIRAKMGSPPLPGENQACADYGTGTISGDTAQFVTDLLN
ncbi:MAG: zinc metalloprotease [Planctomycetota bacterium]|nr:zinc metalloprotease [Planctomycetota bacterium]